VLKGGLKRKRFKRYYEAVAGKGSESKSGYELEGLNESAPLLGVYSHGIRASLGQEEEKPRRR